MNKEEQLPYLQRQEVSVFLAKQIKNYKKAAKLTIKDVDKRTKLCFDFLKWVERNINKQVVAYPKKYLPIIEAKEVER